jgi:Pyridoxamine 5'-phosphate oxidase
MTSALDALQEKTFATVTSATAAAYPQDMRLTGARLTGYLDGHAFGVIGTSRPDGRPHAAVATYIRQDGTFWLPTMAGSVRERNLRAEPWLTLTVSEGAQDGEHTVVLIEGPATVVPLAEVPADVLARAPRYEVWVRLLPERLLSYADDSRP